jgi:hypothetical protein
VIDVGVGNEDVPDAGLLPGRTKKANAAGVDAHGVVDQVRAQKLGVFPGPAGNR